MLVKIDKRSNLRSTEFFLKQKKLYEYKYTQI